MIRKVAAVLLLVGTMVAVPAQDEGNGVPDWQGFTLDSIQQMFRNDSVSSFLDSFFASIDLDSSVEWFNDTGVSREDSAVRFDSLDREEFVEQIENYRDSLAGLDSLSSSDSALIEVLENIIEQVENIESPVRHAYAPAGKMAMPNVNPLIFDLRGRLISPAGKSGNILIKGKAAADKAAGTGGIRLYGTFKAR